MVKINSKNIDEYSKFISLNKTVHKNLSDINIDT